MGIFNFLKKDKKKFEKKELFLSIYTSKKNDDNILNELVNIFGEQVEGAYDTNGYSLDNETKDFMIKLSNGSLITGTLDNSEETQDQSVGMYNYFSTAELENKNLKESILKQISLFNCMLDIKFSYMESEDNLEEIKNQINLLHKGIENCGGFIFSDLNNIFHPNGKLLISKDGKSDFEHFFPVVYGELQ